MARSPAKDPPAQYSFVRPSRALLTRMNRNMAAPDQEQPDFAAMVEDMNVISRSHLSLATNLQRMGNIPALDAGAQILVELRNIGQRLGALERGVAGISTRLSSADYNAVARLTNSALATTADSRLSPLRTPDNQEVPNFPLTPGDIDRLNSADVNAILNSYGLPTVGVVAVRRRQLKKYLGITMAGI